MKPEPSIRVNVDVTNPGQFFACCGLLELADRLWRGSEGWFHGSSFCIRPPLDSPNAATEFAARLNECRILSSMTVEQTARLKVLKNLRKDLRNDASNRETAELSEQWERERLCIPIGRHIWLDWWSDERGDGAHLKTWAGKQLISEIVQGLHDSVKRVDLATVDAEQWLTVSTSGGGLPLYLDSDIGDCSSSRDVGFSMDAIEVRSQIRPVLELLAFVGLQRFRPRTIERRTRYGYATWATPLLPELASVVCGLGINEFVQTKFEFKLFYRTKYLKSFLPAVPFAQGDSL
jgi:CRISPR-associated protein Csb3